MASSYECEVRFLITDIEKYRNRIGELGGIVRYPYEFTDHYYMPRNEKWDPVLKNIRIREWNYPKNPTCIYLIKNEVIELKGVKFKKSFYKEGKLSLFSASLEECKEVMADLGFAPWIIVEKKDCKLYDIPKKFITIEEFIPEIGWTGELEIAGDNLESASSYIKKSLDLLHIKEYTFKSVSRLVAEAKGLV
jgi:adenylate cyclase class IV